MIDDHLDSEKNKFLHDNGFTLQFDSRDWISNYAHICYEDKCDTSMNDLKNAVNKAKEIYKKTGKISPFLLAHQKPQKDIFGKIIDRIKKHI